jgi:pimeloyl-ACP methyl ester carboxylesterase
MAGHSFRRKSVTCAAASGLHRLSYLEWGDAANPRVLVCVHGLTRCARDFDFLAAALADRYRVVCPDMPGRGESDWLKNPLEYATSAYLNAAVTLVARLGVEAVDWVGTSMGGLLGIAYASLAGNPIRRLVVNEAGPLVAAAALERIGTYVGKAPDFASIDEAERYIRAISAPFGPHTDAEWRFLTEHVVRRKPGGGWRVHYDPAIAVPFDAAAPHKDIDLWPVWGEVRCPTLVIRGALSDLLSRETVERMQTTGPRARAVEIPGVGHAPTLMQPGQIAIVRQFLLAG